MTDVDAKRQRTDAERRNTTVGVFAIGVGLIVAVCSGIAAWFMAGIAGLSAAGAPPNTARVDAFSTAIIYSPWVLIPAGFLLVCYGLWRCGAGNAP